LGACLLLRDFVDEALQEARAALDEGEVPVGALIVRGEEVLARAHNEREALSDPTAHAEILAIRRAARRTGDWRLSGTTLIVTLEPCIMCAGAILEARISRVVFGAPDSVRGAAGSMANLFSRAHADHDVEVTGGILEERCQEILRRFFSSRRGV